MTDTQNTTAPASLVPEIRPEVWADLEQRYRKLEDTVRRYNPSANFQQIRAAFEFAAKAHGAQMRKDGSPFITHPLAVAQIVAEELHLDSESIEAALLHDTIEDTSATHEDISRLFSPTVADLVEGVSKLTRVHYTSKEEEQMENLRKMLMAMSKDIRVILIKISDRLHNMRTMEYQTPEKQKQKSFETMEIYAPIAHRLGMQKMKWELEDLSLKYLDPISYREIVEALNEKAAQYDGFMSSIHDQITRRLREAHIDGYVYGRMKHPYSIYRKMYTQNKSLDDVYDLFAFRVIVDTVSDCYNVLGIIHDLYKPILGRFKDYIGTPKPNGYQSLHTTVIGADGLPFEVQIRTKEMHEIAEYGVAAHWKYKHATISQDEDEFDKWLKQIRAALNSPTENAVDFLDNFKLSLYTSEIVVFTPKGEARKMPFGATALDFAYDIHSKIGNSAISAKINHKLEPITTQINSGDQIEIITADNARPKPEWLETVTTAKAKQSIKSFLKRERQNNIERGMQMLDEKMKSLNVKLSGRVLRKITPIYDSKNKEELYSKIGAGIVSLDNLDKALKVNSKSKILKFWTLFIPQKKEDETDDAAIPGEIAPAEEAPATEPQFEIAECCKPIPGDKVVGYRDPASGNIIVHKATCDELNRLATQFGRNIVKEEIKWSQHKAMSYLVTTELRGIDRQGILLDLAKVVSADFNINIREVNIHSHDGIFEGNVSLYVKDAESLHAVMDKLRKIKGIESVKRTLS